jgi:hypothetical protein
MISSGRPVTRHRRIDCITIYFYVYLLTFLTGFNRPTILEIDPHFEGLASHTDEQAVREGGESSAMKFLWIVPLLVVPFLVSLYGAIALLTMPWTHEAPGETIPVILLFSAIAVYLLRLLIKNLFEPNGGVILTDVLVSTHTPRKRAVTLDSGYKYYALYVLIAYLLIPWFRKREKH